MDKMEQRRFARRLVKAKQLLAEAYDELDGLDGATDEGTAGMRAAVRGIDQLARAEANYYGSGPLADALPELEHVGADMPASALAWMTPEQLRAAQ